VWRKERGTGFQLAKYRPMIETESCLVFCKTTPKYNPQMIPLDKPKKESFAGTKSGSSPIANLNKGSRIATHRYPKNILEISRDINRIHPTQKPVALFEYLIKTYTNEGDLVLDNCAGSGTTGVACKNTNRNYILIEKEPKYIDIINKRLNSI
jgi:site-specific DNA-methyltransferase (adenine-specific)